MTRVECQNCEWMGNEMDLANRLPLREGGCVMTRTDPRELNPTHDCNTCPMWRGKGNKYKGKTVKEGYGKCIRLQGPCENPKPRLGIGGVKKGYDDAL